MRTITLVCVWVMLLAGIVSAAQDGFKECDDLFTKAYQNGGSQTHKAAMDIALKAIKNGDHSFDAYWRASRGCRSYAEEIKRENIQNEAVWKPVCEKFGRMGMEYGEKAIALNNNRVEGWIFYGMSVGTYADGVSIFKAVKEGLVKKTRQSFEKAYEINKMYLDGVPITCLGRMWNVLPWPMKDNKNSLKYLREVNKLVPDNPEPQVYLAIVLLDMGKADDKAEAKVLLSKAANGNNPYFADWAKRELANVK